MKEWAKTQKEAIIINLTTTTDDPGSAKPAPTSLAGTLEEAMQWLEQL